MIRVTLILILVLACNLVIDLYAQNSNPLDDMLLNPDTPKTGNIKNTTENDSLVNDIIRINYDKKNAQLAMLMSALVPGSGQFYVDHSSIMAYIYPIIELAVIGGIVYYDNQGDKKTKAFKKYVNEVVTIDINGYSYTGPRYVRAFQDTVQALLSGIHTADIYDGVFFNLDKTNSQHYYEDIGKYNKYIFGWADWYLTYGELPPIGQPLNPVPIFVFDSDANSQLNKWQFNVPLAGPSNRYDRPNSDLRDAYVDMRKAAEDKYRVANYLAFGIALNHIVSAIDAARMANNQNRLYLSENKVNMQYYASLRDGHLTPMLGLKYSF